MQQNSKCCYKSGLYNMRPPHKEACDRPRFGVEFLLAHSSKEVI